MKQVLILCMLLVALYAALSYGLYSGLTQRAAGATDFYSRWVGARALFLHGQNPYSDSVSREIQIGMYGRLARADEDQVAFAYPLYTALVIAPLVALPYAQAQALWMAFLIISAVAGTLVLARHNHISLKPAWFAGLLIGAMIFYPAVRGIFLGQLAIVSFFCLAFAVWAIDSRFDALAGTLVALATVKPQTAIFLVPAILLWATWHRRWRIVGGAAIALGFLCVLALALVPTWPLDFLQAVRQYTVYEPIGPPVQTAVEMIRRDALGTYATLVLGLGLFIWMARSVVRNLNATWEGYQPTVCLVAVVTTLTAGRVGTPDQLLLLFPLTYWLGKGLTRFHYAQVVLLALGFIVLPWFAFLSTLRGNAEDVVVTLVLPSLSLIVLLWDRFSDRRIVAGSTA